MNGSEMYVSRDPGTPPYAPTSVNGWEMAVCVFSPRIPRIGTPLSFPRRTVYVREAPTVHATTVTLSPGCERAVTVRRIADVGVAVTFTYVMRLPKGMGPGLR